MFSDPKAFANFLLWEKATRDVLDVKRVYIDMAGDLAAGVALSEIVYWHLPDQRGRTKLRVEKDGRWWIAAPRAAWWERCRLNANQADYALGKLVQRGLIEKRIFKFNGNPTVHVRLHVEAFLKAHQEVLQHPPLNPFSENSEIEFGQPPISEISEIELGNNAKTINKDSDPPSPPPAADAVKNKYPGTVLEAVAHPDLRLYRRITGRLPSESDWPGIIQRLALLRSEEPEMSEDQWVEAGSVYWQAWIACGYSNPGWLERWINKDIPTRRKPHKRVAAVPTLEPQPVNSPVEPQSITGPSSADIERIQAWKAGQDSA